ncbi:bile acid:sodium symporter family protein [Gammaproteobacteria bacterium]|jgi:bile acid:Na+ symporter, BASS family|nr:bile acid:sodium symporter family protein [Gammaproteobacteria bacterium]MCH9855630.1 bile acid:sodium symporter family protein [Gammaproteobacteria bacterium]MDA9187985.1 bile acid:sodium symporter family protein [bacterium]MDA9568632.1 bile acid:sodium symporter family protein [Gammaproteobacteria bacterium]MDC1503122.1 bile acid:sodium symporter family protein [Gammaproteobacteria bacterium]
MPAIKSKRPAVRHSTRPPLPVRSPQSRLTKLFPILAIAVAATGALRPDSFVAAQFTIIPLLASIMFMMGLTLTRDDAQRIARDPRPVAVGVALQFLLMPILALTLAKLLQLSTPLTVGMVLVGSCAGGTASNVICFLARGDVALSVSMTFVSTLIGVVATPLLSQFYLAEQVAVDELAMIESLLQIVFVPVISGFCFRAVLPRLSAALQPALPLFSVICILLIIGIVVALNAPQLRGIGPLIVLAVILHNALGIAGGFTLSRLFGFDLKQSQTIAIEVGMQNSGLAAALSLQFFSATAALPAALFSIWHNISGALLAGHWGRQRDSLKYLLADVKDSEMDGA